MSAEEYDFNRALGWFASLPHENQEGLVRACESADPEIDLPQLGRKIAAASGHDPDHTQALLIGLGGIFNLVGVDPEMRQFATNYLLSLAGADQQADDITKRCFDRLLRCERSIGLSNKAQGVMWGLGRVFKGAQTISQIRPVFQNDLKANVGSAVIVHELRIDYREGMYESAWSVAMNKAQIEYLIEILRRSLSKEENIRKTEAFLFLDAERA